MGSANDIGSIGWFDLTVPDADTVRDFYKSVVGWGVQDVDMGGYSDYAMTHPTTGQPVAGVCHARGVNADLPPVWLAYITVADVDAAAEACRASGGAVVAGPSSLGELGRVCVIRDPAGAVVALFTPAATGG